MSATWSPLRSAWGTIGGARGWDDRVWLARYLAGRRVAPLAPAPGHRTVHFAGLDTPVSVDPAVGGMSTYYEIVVAGVYARRPEFVPPLGGCVVDVGANIGMYAAWAATRTGPAGRVVAIEPHPLAFDLLAENAARLAAETTVRNVACGADPAVLPLRFAEGRLSTATLAAPETEVAAGRVDVRVERLDDVVDDAGITHVDVLKIDVEGWEAEVLQGAAATLARTAHVVVEATDAQRPVLESQLSAAGLELVGAVRGIWDDPGLSVLYASRGAMHRRP